MDQLMNTKEVAGYLGIHEKKVYFLVKAGKIPCTRVTGKWIFPKNLIDQWIEESATGPMKKRREEERPFLLAAGSDDPSLGILQDFYLRRRTSTSLFLATVGSSAGIEAIGDGVADLALAHLLTRQPENTTCHTSGRSFLPGPLPSLFSTGSSALWLGPKTLLGCGRWPTWSEPV